MEAMESLKLTVEVLLFVTGVSVGVQTHSVGVVEVEITKLHGVPPFANMRFFQHQPLVLVKVSATEFLIVDCKIWDSNCLKVDPEVAIWWGILKIEVYGGFAHVVVALVNRDLKIILNLAYKFESLLSLSFLESDVLVVARVEVSFVSQVFHY